MPTVLIDQLLLTPTAAETLMPPNPYCRRNPTAAETSKSPAFQQESPFSSDGEWQSVRWFRRIRELLRLVGIRQLIPFFQTRRTTESDFLSVPFTNVFSSQVFRTDLISHDRTFRVDHSNHGRFGGRCHRRHGCRRCFSFSAPRKKIDPTTNKQKTNTISHLRTPPQKIRRALSPATLTNQENSRSSCMETSESAIQSRSTLPPESIRQSVASGILVLTSHLCIANSPFISRFPRQKRKLHANQASRLIHGFAVPFRS